MSGDTVAERKPHPLPTVARGREFGVAPDACVYVGDAERDIVAGRAAGMQTVVAAYGYLGEDDDPTAWHATGIVQQAGDIATWLSSASPCQPGNREGDDLMDLSVPNIVFAGLAALLGLLVGWLAGRNRTHAAELELATARA